MNISCDVMSNPPATMLWRRERFTISTEGTANMRVHNAEGKSVLEVSGRLTGYETEMSWEVLIVHLLCEHDLSNRDAEEIMNSDLN